MWYLICFSQSPPTRMMHEWQDLSVFSIINRVCFPLDRHCFWYQKYKDEEPQTRQGERCETVKMVNAHHSGRYDVLWSGWGNYCYARCPNPRVGREKASKTMQLTKREVYCWLESGLLPHPTQWCGVREPRAQAVTQIYRVSTHRWFKPIWFKQIGSKFAKQFHWSNTLKTFARAGLSRGFPPRS